MCFNRKKIGGVGDLGKFFLSEIDTLQEGCLRWRDP